MLIRMLNLIDHLTFRATLEPACAAVCTPDLSITWKQLLLVVKGAARRLRLAGLQPGQVAVTSMRNQEVDWVLTLALFHEAALSCSSETLDALPSSVTADWFITDRKSPAKASAKTIVIDNDWLAAARDEYEPIDARNYESSDALVRLVLTSGTTGRGKAVALTLGQVIGRAERGMALRGAHTGISTLGLATAADFNFAVTCLMTDAPLMVPRTMRDAVDLIRQHGLEGILSTPTQLAAIVDLLEAAGEVLDSVKMVRCGGGSMSSRLVERIRRNITTNILALYGSTEAFGMCAFKPTPRSNPAVAGHAGPDAKVEVVDAQGQSLPRGEVGLVRVKTPFMVAGYYGDEAESARSFRDGWFYPGDRGAIAADGRLVLAGREGDLLNHGGVKFDPTVLDRFLAEVEGIKDAAVFLAPTESGVTRVAAAVVAGADFNAAALRTVLAARFPTYAPTLFVNVAKIPRNAMGKVMRPALSSSYAAQAGKPRSA